MIIELLPYKQSDTILRQPSIITSKSSSTSIISKVSQLTEYIQSSISLISNTELLQEHLSTTKQSIKRAIPHKQLDILLIETNTNQMQLLQNDKIIDTFQTNATTSALSPLMYTHITTSFNKTSINKHLSDSKALLIAYSSCGGFIVTCEKIGFLYTLNITSTQTFEKLVMGLSMYKAIQIDYSPCGAYIGILYANMQVLVYSLNGFTKVCQDQGVTSFCWMDTSLIVTGKNRGLKCFHMPSKRWLEIESKEQFEFTRRIEYVNGRISVIGFVDGLMKSRYFKINWVPCLGIERVFEVVGEVAMIRETLDKNKRRAKGFTCYIIEESAIRIEYI